MWHHVKIYGHAGIHSENTATLISLQIRKTNVHMAHSTEKKLWRLTVSENCFNKNCIFCIFNKHFRRLKLRKLSDECLWLPLWQFWIPVSLYHQTKRWSWSVRNLWVYHCCNVCGFQGIWIVIWSLFGENQIFALFSEKLSVCICDKVFRRNIKAGGDEVRVSWDLTKRRFGMQTEWMWSQSWYLSRQTVVEIFSRQHHVFRKQREIVTTWVIYVLSA